ncbi:MAG: hypothetical protein ABIP65_08525, partial [Vicinamibacterales bacterium]
PRRWVTVFTPHADVRTVALIMTAAVLTGCGHASQESTHAASAGATSQTQELRVSGTSFSSAGQPFEWRGITAFRLAEMVASGREGEAIAFLDWAKREQLTVVRVLLTARHLFTLTPENGRRALPRLLDLARDRGLAVEAVALADTAAAPFDYEAHVRDVGRIAAEKGNAFVELANEPGHPTQDRRLHDPAFVAKLASLVPEPVLVALGSVEYGDGYGGGDYVTFHAPRGAQEWDHVLGLAGAARLTARFPKPVISDEPIGAHAAYQPGRRDNEPARFAAAAALTRLAGLGATFHYEGGLQAVTPTGRQASCFAAWRQGLTLVGPEMVEGGEFLEEVSSIADIDGARRTYARVSATRAYVLLIEPSASATVRWHGSWAERGRTVVPGVRLISAGR